jgi:hypothetical protein
MRFCKFLSYTYKYKMRNLSEFKNIHQGKDIYVIGSGYSGEFIDPGFFDDKITIGINQVYKRFPVKYLVRKEHKNIQTLFKEFPNAVWFVSKYNTGAYKLNAFNELIDNSSNICIFDHINNEINKKIINIPDDILITSYSTITSGIHLAAFMGAKNIILVGHDCGTLDNKCNFEGYHTKESMWWKNGETDYKKWLPKIEATTIEVKKLIKEKYGCNTYSLNPFINFALEGHIYKKD